MAIERYIVTGDSMMLDAVIWRRFQRPMPGLVERTLDLNPGLAAAGPLLPVGTVINIPVDAPVAPKVINIVKLWD